MNKARNGCDKLTFFRHSAERNSVHLWWSLFLCATDEEGFSTGKRCFLVSFTDGVGEKERNSTKISQLNLQGLFYIVPDVLLFLYLSITAYPFLPSVP